MKKIICTILLLILSLALFSCGEEPTPTPEPADTTYTVTFVQEGKDDITYEVNIGEVFDASGLQDPQGTAKNGYKWVWELPDFTANTSNDITVTAKQIPLEYVLTITVDGVIETKTIAYDAQYSLTAPTKENYNFTRWVNVLTAEEFPASGTWNYTSNIAIRAEFVPTPKQISIFGLSLNDIPEALRANYKELPEGAGVYTEIASGSKFELSPVVAGKFFVCFTDLDGKYHDAYKTNGFTVEGAVNLRAVTAVAQTDSYVLAFLQEGEVPVVVDVANDAVIADGNIPTAKETVIGWKAIWDFDKDAVKNTDTRIYVKNEAKVIKITYAVANSMLDDYAKKVENTDNEIVKEGNAYVQYVTYNSNYQLVNEIFSAEVKFVGWKIQGTTTQLDLNGLNFTLTDQDIVLDLVSTPKTPDEMTGDDAWSEQV